MGKEVRKHGRSRKHGGAKGKERKRPPGDKEEESGWWLFPGGQGPDKRTWLTPVRGRVSKALRTRNQKHLTWTKGTDS